MRLYFVSTLIIVQFAIIILGLLQPENRATVKQFLLRSDAVLFNGALRRWRHHQQMPRNNMASITAHAANDYSWLDAEPFLVIGHGLGPKLYGGENTLKTLEKGWERGFRIFEVDLSVTSDNHLVCYHGGEEREIDKTSYADYLKRMKAEGHQPCRFSDIVGYARQHPETRFVLDVKNRFYDAYAMARHEIGDPSLGKSFIPQVYDFEQLPDIRKGNFFAGEIFTSYRSALTNRQIFDAAKTYDVRAVTLTTQRFFNHEGKFSEKISVFTHPINDPFIAKKVQEQGGRGIYTSYVNQFSVPELFGHD
ncbi:hypothetical protein FO488_01000 [Geobacter sp. FeAm09]|uniref:glycerophosphodiester phosphodiesterase family protein n=1 Tax=Geobacter sp. FeAm09 TaxID=2597769 RepID=UPI0011F08413|nr:glycerophosphodiester phosphodiesterase family protein [Geobacter sp. FeAm09]QEM66874.1 hypothetical protein FO488_01000 [Geobacter sp. FeAm09]